MRGQYDCQVTPRKEACHIFNKVVQKFEELIEVKPKKMYL